MDFALTPFGTRTPGARIFNELTPWGDDWPMRRMGGDVWGVSPYMENQLGSVDTAGRRAMGREMSKFSPILSCDIVEAPDDFHVHIDLPGVTKDALTVEVDSTERKLHIRADRESVSEEDTDYVHRRERNFGKVSRTIPVPQGADTAKAKTLFQNGVLTVSFPKLTGATAGSRKLEIEEKAASG